MSTETNLRAPKDARRGGYEHSDADVRSLLKFGLTLLVILVAVLISMKWMFLYFAKSQQLGPPASPFENTRVLPPAPWLQVQPRADLHAYCADQLDELNTYGWVDPHNEVVRVPIDRAMDLIAQRGLPARSDASSAPGTTAAAEGAGALTVPQAKDWEGVCGHLVIPPAPEEKK
jgi:hypothetical protein